MQLEKAGSKVLNTTKPETETQARRPWVEASVWTERMLTRLPNGVKGGKWFSLMDKVYVMRRLPAAWQQVASIQGTHGVDFVPIERFATNQKKYLLELHEALKNGRYQPLPVKLVYIPKNDGSRRPP